MNAELESNVGEDTIIPLEKAITALEANFKEDQPPNHQQLIFLLTNIKEEYYRLLQKHKIEMELLHQELIKAKEELKHNLNYLAWNH